MASPPPPHLLSFFFIFIHFPPSAWPHVNGLLDVRFFLFFRLLSFSLICFCRALQFMGWGASNKRMVIWLNESDHSAPDTRSSVTCFTRYFPVYPSLFRVIQVFCCAPLIWRHAAEISCVFFLSLSSFWGRFVVSCTPFASYGHLWCLHSPKCFARQRSF